MRKALIAMSGGVDSSVAAALMCREGFDCIGATMKLFNGEDAAGRETACCSLESTDDARRVAYRLGMPYYVLNFTDSFAGAVIDRFVSEYLRGNTPNPCIDCNRFLKFGKLFERADILQCDVLVTGHYARVERDARSGRWLLKKARCAEKDQSYVLYFLKQEQLARIRFPLGQFRRKEDVRTLAEQYGFRNARKPDSQDICFVPDGRYADFIERYTGTEYPHGAFIDERGGKLGEHGGLLRYTVGQRKGLGVACGQPMYVRRKNAAENTVTLVPKERLCADGLYAGDFNWISREPPEQPVPVTVQTRYRATEAPATARAMADGRVYIRFNEPQKAAAPGQAVVLYEGDTVVGGGTVLDLAD